MSSDSDHVANAVVISAGSTFTLLTTMRPAPPALKPPVLDRTILAADLCARMQARVGSGAP